MQSCIKTPVWSLRINSNNKFATWARIFARRQNHRVMSYLLRVEWSFSVRNNRWQGCETGSDLSGFLPLSVWVRVSRRGRFQVSGFCRVEPGHTSIRTPIRIFIGSLHPARAQAGLAPAHGRGCAQHIDTRVPSSPAAIDTETEAGPPDSAGELHLFRNKQTEWNAYRETNAQLRLLNNPFSLFITLLCGWGERKKGVVVICLNVVVKQKFRLFIPLLKDISSYKQKHFIVLNSELLQTQNFLTLGYSPVSRLLPADFWTLLHLVPFRCWDSVQVIVPTRPPDPGTFALIPGSWFQTHPTQLLNGGAYVRGEGGVDSSPCPPDGP